MRSLQGRLFLSILAAVLLAVGASLALGIVLTRNAVRSTLRADVIQQADAVYGSLLTRQAGGLQFQGGGPRPAAGPAPAPVLGSGPGQAGGAGGDGAAGGIGGVLVPRPLQVVTFARAVELLPSAVIARLRRQPVVSGTARIEGHELIFAARRDGRRVILVTRPNLISRSDFSSYLSALFIASGVAALLAALRAMLLARRVNGPLRHLAAAAGQLAAGRHPEPLRLDGPREIDSVAASFNTMAEQLALSRDAERGLLLSVSHDLRTPLTSIRGYAEGIQDGTIEPAPAATVIGREAGRLERMVGDLLALARLRQGVLEIHREAVDLRAVAHEAQQRLGPAANEAGVQVNVEGEGSVVQADHGRTLQVLSNLLENAIRLTPRGTVVTVTVGPGTVAVSDEGPGIPADELPRAFERFHLRDRIGRSSGSGAGVGLAIVRELSEAMGGSVTVENLPERGARFTVSLPQLP